MSHAVESSAAFRRFAPIGIPSKNCCVPVNLALVKSQTHRMCIVCFDLEVKTVNRDFYKNTSQNTRRCSGL
jgi:hypothetical protein